MVLSVNLEDFKKYRSLYFLKPERSSNDRREAVACAVHGGMSLSGGRQGTKIIREENRVEMLVDKSNKRFSALFPPVDNFESICITNSVVLSGICISDSAIYFVMYQ